MFIIRYFKNSIFSLKGIYDLKDENLLKIIVYFLLVSLISLFPYNFKIVEEKGFNIGFLSEVYKDLSENSFKNTKVKKIGKAGLRVESDFTCETYHFENIIIIFDYDNTYNISENVDKNVLILKKDTMRFYDTSNHFMVGNYEAFNRDYSFSEFVANQSLFEEFFLLIEKGFYSYSILFSVLNYTFTSIGMYLLMILLMAGILSFLKYGFSKSMPFMSIVKILVLAMTLPSIIVFLIGWIPNMYSFSPIIMNFLIGGIGLLVMLKVAKNRLEIETGK